RMTLLAHVWRRRLPPLCYVWLRRLPSNWFQTPGKFFDRHIPSKWDLNSGNGACRIALHHRFGRNRFRDDTSSSHYRAATNNDVRQHNHSRSDGNIFFNYDATLLPIVGDYHSPHPNCRSITNRDQVWVRRLYNRIISYPHILSNLYAAPAVEANPRRCRSRGNSGEDLKNPVF